MEYFTRTGFVFFPSGTIQNRFDLNNFSLPAIGCFTKTNNNNFINNSNLNSTTMKKQFMFSLGALVLAMTLIFSTSVSAQQKSAGVPTGVSTVHSGSSATAAQKQITRAQFIQLSGSEQAALLADMSNVNITDLVNATPSDLAHRQDNLFYIPAAEFKNYSADRQWQILKNPNSYKVVQDAAQIPKIEIPKAQYDAMPQSKKDIIRNSSDYIIIN